MDLDYTLWKTSMSRLTGTQNNNETRFKDPLIPWLQIRMVETNHVSKVLDLLDWISSAQPVHDQQWRGYRHRGCEWEIRNQKVKWGDQKSLENTNIYSPISHCTVYWMLVRKNLPADVIVSHFVPRFVPNTPNWTCSSYPHRRMCSFVRLLNQTSANPILRFVWLMSGATSVPFLICFGL